MAASNYTPHQVNTLELQILQESVNEAFQNVDRDSWTILRGDNGTIETFALASGAETLIRHGLGKTVNGYKVIWQDASATIYSDPNTTADLTKYLPLTASAAVNVKLEVIS